MIVQLVAPPKKTHSPQHKKQFQGLSKTLKEAFRGACKEITTELSRPLFLVCNYYISPLHTYIHLQASTPLPFRFLWSRHIFLLLTLSAWEALIRMTCSLALEHHHHHHTKVCTSLEWVQRLYSSRAHPATPSLFPTAIYRHTYSPFSLELPYCPRIFPLVFRLP